MWICFSQTDLQGPQDARVHLPHSFLRVNRNRAMGWSDCLQNTSQLDHPPRNEKLGPELRPRVRDRACRVPKLHARYGQGSSYVPTQVRIIRFYIWSATASHPIQWSNPCININFNLFNLPLVCVKFAINIIRILIEIPVSIATTIWLFVYIAGLYGGYQLCRSCSPSSSTTRRDDSTSAETQAAGSSKKLTIRRKKD